MRSLVFYEDEREKLVTARTAYLLSGNSILRGENYYPFDPDNFAEFLENMPAHDLEAVRKAAEKQYFKVPDHDVSELLVSAAKRYWLKLAQEKAEGNIKSAEQACREGGF